MDLVNLEIRMAEGEVPEWVMLARPGVWRGHPQRPQTVTPDDLRSALDYFNTHYAGHGTDLLIDYAHATRTAALLGGKAPAAGWVQEMDLRAGGQELWGRVLWTTDAANAIAQREYRYLSPVFRFGSKDRVTGKPVQMWIPDVGLTNQPFITELTSLNDVGAIVAAGGPARPDGGHAATEEEKPMELLAMLAAALAQTVEDVANSLGVASDAGKDEVGAALKAKLARLNELESADPPEPETVEVLPPDVANSLGIDAGADARAVRVALIRLQAPNAGMASVRVKLGLADDARDADVLNSIGHLQGVKRQSDAEELVDAAVKDGRVQPAHRAFYLAQAEADIDAARDVINSLTPINDGGLGDRTPPKPGTGLSDAEATVANAMGLTAEEVAAARK